MSKNITVTKQEVHNNSLKLLDELIKNNPEKVKEIISKHKGTVKGPTYSQYLISL